jgi:predicted MFS family arabinose efflux permease
VSTGAPARAARLALGTAAALGIARFGYGLLLPAMREDLGWSLAQAGAMTTANSVGYLAGATLAALCVRRRGATATFRLGLLLTALALAATVASGVYPALLAARAAAGLGGALVFVAGGVIASRDAADTLSAAPVAVYFSGAGLGIAACGLWLPPFTAHAPERWPLAWAGLAALCAAATAASWTAARSEEPARGTPAGRRVLRRLWRTATAYTLFAGGYIAYITFLSAALAARHTPPWQVALLWTLLGAAALAAPRLWARPLAAWPPDRTLTALLALLACAGLLPLLPAGGLSTAVLALSVLAYGAGFMTVPAAVTTLIRTTCRPPDWAPTLAVLTVLFSAGQTAGPWAAGFIADHTTPDATLLWTTALCATAAAVTATTPHPAVRRGR